MPTTRRRHIITESEAVAAALRDAAQVWPEDAQRPGKLVARLVLAGHQAIKDQRDLSTANRRAAIEASSGSLTGVYGSDYLMALRDEWPE